MQQGSPLLYFCQFLRCLDVLSKIIFYPRIFLLQTGISCNTGKIKTTYHSRKIFIRGSQLKVYSVIEDLSEKYRLDNTLGLMYNCTNWSPPFRTFLKIVIVLLLNQTSS